MFKISQTFQYRCNRRLIQNVSSFIFGDYALECNHKNSQYVSEYNGRRNYRTYTKNQNADRQILKFFGISFGVGVGIYLYNTDKKEPVLTASKTLDETLGGQPVEGLPFYTLKDVSQHCTKEKRIWVTFKQGVYDITDFVDKHPGSDKIMMAAGGSVEPFWLMYGVHKQPEIIALLETFRIGNLSVEEAEESTRNMEDPYSTDPLRHPALRAASLKPYNAEPPPSLLADSFITPVDLFYVRNHLPVPDVDPESYRLSIEGVGVKSVELTLEDIKKFPKYTVTAAIQCAGNRRKEMSKVKEVKGLSWDVAAIGNATFSGARLYDVLSCLGLKEDDPTAQHVQFEGLDTDPANVPYGASIPFIKAMNPKADVLLAYEMNGKPLTRDHGFPIRAVVPGTVGARNVKWLGAIYVTEEESQSHWQQNDYKGFSPSTDWDTVDFKKSPAIQELPVTSAFCEPNNDDTVTVNNGNILVKGYAWSGGGNRIVRVDITPDGGKNWYVADFIQQDSKTIPYHWAWTLWQAKIPVSEKDEKVELWVKAVDSSYNNQPETFNHIWNLRGVLGNAFHRIKVNLKH